MWHPYLKLTTTADRHRHLPHPHPPLPPRIHTQFTAMNPLSYTADNMAGAILLYIRDIRDAAVEDYFLAHKDISFTGIDLDILARVAAISIRKDAHVAEDAANMIEANNMCGPAAAGRQVSDTITLTPGSERSKVYQTKESMWLGQDTALCGGSRRGGFREPPCRNHPKVDVSFEDDVGQVRHIKLPAKSVKKDPTKTANTKKANIRRKHTSTEAANLSQVADCVDLGGGDDQKVAQACVKKITPTRAKHLFNWAAANPDLFSEIEFKGGLEHLRVIIQLMEEIEDNQAGSKTVKAKTVKVPMDLFDTPSTTTYHKYTPTQASANLVNSLMEEPLNYDDDFGDMGHLDLEAMMALLS